MQINNAIIISQGHHPVIKQPLIMLMHAQLLQHANQGQQDGPHSPMACRLLLHPTSPPHTDKTTFVLKWMTTVPHIQTKTFKKVLYNYFTTLFATTDQPAPGTISISACSSTHQQHHEPFSDNMKWLLPSYPNEQPIYDP